MSERKFEIRVIHLMGDEERDAWKRLWELSPERHFFNAPEFFEASIEAFDTKQYRVFMAYQGDELFAVWPFVEDQVFGIRTLLGPGRRGNYLDKPTLLMKENDELLKQQLLAEVLAYGNVYVAEVEEQDVPHFRSGQPLSFAHPSSLSYKLPLRADTDLLQYLTSEQKRKLLSRLRSTEKDLSFFFASPITGETLAQVVAVEKGSDKGRRGKAFFTNIRSRRFMESLIQRTPERVQIGVLSYRGEPVATNLGFVCHGVFFGYHMAFLETHRTLGVGKLAFYTVLERLKQKGFTRVDFLRGDSELKRQFAKEVVWQHDLYFSKNRSVFLWWWLCVTGYAWMKRLKDWAVSVPSGLRFIWRNVRNAFFKGPVRISGKIKHLFGRDPSRSGDTEKRHFRPHVIFSSYDSVTNPFYGGGGAIGVHEIARHLTKIFEVRVLAGSYPGCQRYAVIDRVHYEYIGSAFFGPKLGQLMFHLILPYHVLKRSFDVWMESFTPPFSTSFLPLFTRKPVVGLGHMLSGEDMRRKYGFPFQLIEHLGLRCYRYIIVTSEHFRKRILRLNPRACTEVIQNGINLQEFKEPSESSRRGFSFLGRIEVDQKGLDLLLQAYALFAQTEEVVPLYIAGTGNHKEMVKLRRLIKEHHLQEHVVFKGWVSGKERIGFLQQSLGNIVSSRFETFSLVALETLAAGTPLIAFDIPGIRWIPDECALKVPVFETRALADALVKVVRDEKERDRLTLAGQEFSKSFDWKQKASQYEHFIRTVLGQYASSHHQ